MLTSDGRLGRLLGRLRERLKGENQKNVPWMVNGEGREGKEARGCQGGGGGTMVIRLIESCILHTWLWLCVHGGFFALRC